MRVQRAALARTRFRRWRHAMNVRLTHIDGKLPSCGSGGVESCRARLQPPPNECEEEDR